MQPTSNNLQEPLIRGTAPVPQPEFERLSHRNDQLPL